LATKDWEKSQGAGKYEHPLLCSKRLFGVIHEPWREMSRSRDLADSDDMWEMKSMAGWSFLTKDEKSRRSGLPRVVTLAQSSL